jgi:ABC-type glycerol-3-phosphate transport system substrate-binding protein
VRYGWGAYRGWFPFLTFLYANDGRLLEDGEPAFTHPANVEALQWFVQQHESGIAPKSSWSHGGDAAESVFLRGDSAMVITGNWRLATFNRQIRDFEWDVTYLPRRKRRATNLGGENLMVFKTPRVESAALLAGFLTRPDRMKDFCSRTMFLPTRESLLREDVPYRLRPDAMKKFAIQAADFEPAWAAAQSTAQFATIENSFLKQIELAVLGFQSAQASLEILNEEYRNALEE